MAQKLTIEFQATGDKALINAIKQMDIATKRLQGTTSKYEKELKKLKLQQGEVNDGTMLGVKNQRLLGNTFATLRSKLLLASFAMGMFAKSLGKLGSLYGFQEAAEKRLSIALGGNIDLLKAYATQVQKNTAFGDEEVITAMALIANYTTEEKVVKQLMDATLDLAAAKGKNLSEAAELVSKSVFSTTNALQREGVTVEGTSGSVQRLTSLTGNLAALYGGQAKAATLTYNGAIKDLQDSLGDLGENLGEVLVPALKASARLIQILAEYFDTEKVKSYSVAIGLLGTGYLVLSGTIATATTASLTFIKANKRVFIAMLAITAAAEIMDRVFDVFGDDVEDLDDELEELNAAIGNMGSKVDVASTALQSWNRHLNYSISLIKERYAEDRKSGSIAEKLEILETRRLAIMDKATKKIGNSIDIEVELNAVETEIFNARQQRQQQQIANSIEMANAVLDVAGSYNKLQQMQMNQAKQAELDGVKGVRNEKIRQKKIDAINKKYAAEQDEINKKTKRMKRAQTAINTSVALMEVWADDTMKLPGKIIMSALVTALGATQLKMIDSQKYQYGGLVGGSRHSQGGTMIEAERGEFVMSRDATEAIGIENLNRMNTGAGNVGASIIINNPILGKDTIEDEIIPQIKEALRRGASI